MAAFLVLMSTTSVSELGLLDAAPECQNEEVVCCDRCTLVATANHIVSVCRAALLPNWISRRTSCAGRRRRMNRFNLARRVAVTGTSSDQRTTVYWTARRPHTAAFDWRHCCTHPLMQLRRLTYTLGVHQLNRWTWWLLYTKWLQIGQRWTSSEVSAKDDFWSRNSLE